MHEHHDYDQSIFLIKCVNDKERNYFELVRYVKVRHKYIKHVEGQK